MAEISGKVAYQPGTTTTLTTAEEAVSTGAGVCQDHTHIFQPPRGTWDLLPGMSAVTC